MALFQHPNVKSSMSHANLDASQHVSVMMCEQACGTSRPTTARGSLDCACPSAGRHVVFGANMCGFRRKRIPHLRRGFCRKRIPHLRRGFRRKTHTPFAMWLRSQTHTPFATRQLGLRLHFVHACMYTCTLIVAVPTHVQESRICSARCALRAQIAHRESCTNARKQSGVDAVHRHVRGSFFVLAVECLLGVHCRLAQGTSQHDGRQ